MSKNRRRLINYSIKRKMQFRLLLAVMLVVFVSVSLTSGFFYLMSNQEVGQTYRQFHINAKNFLDILLPAVIIAFAVGMVAAVIIAIFIPHRIAGPLYRMERELKERVGAGDFTVVFGVRKGDELGELASALNVMVAKLRDRMGAVREAAEGISAAAKETRADKRVADAAKKLEETVKEFKA